MWCAWRGPCSMTRMRSYRAGPGAGAPLTVNARSADAAGASDRPTRIVENGTSQRRRMSPPVTERPDVTPRPTALDAFLRARKRFLACERVDMSALAAELGVSRVTLYRWVGSRDRLLVEVIWSLAARTLEKIDTDVKERGPERIVRIVT